MHLKFKVHHIHLSLFPANCTAGFKMLPHVSAANYSHPQVSTSVEDMYSVLYSRQI